MLTVAILGECSGVIRAAFAAMGHNAVSCDLKESRIPGQHIVGDYTKRSWRGTDLLIWHPDCTYLAVSGLHWNRRRPERQALTDESVTFVIETHAAFLQQVPALAMENPIGCLSTRWRRPTQIVHPWQYGDDASKATCLWLDGLPPLVPTNILPGGRLARRSNQTASGQNKLGPSPMRKELRSNTYPGIAAAMASQWGSVLSAA